MFHNRGGRTCLTYLPMLNEVEKASIDERQPLPDRYRGLDDDGDGPPHRGGARDARTRGCSSSATTISATK